MMISMPAGRPPRGSGTPAAGATVRARAVSGRRHAAAAARGLEDPGVEGVEGVVPPRRCRRPEGGVGPGGGVLSTWWSLIFCREVSLRRGADAAGGVRGRDGGAEAVGGERMNPPGAPPRPPLHGRACERFLQAEGRDQGLSSSR